MLEKPPSQRNCPRFINLAPCAAGSGGGMWPIGVKAAECASSSKCGGLIFTWYAQVQVHSKQY